LLISSLFSSVSNYGNNLFANSRSARRMVFSVARWLAGLDAFSNGVVEVMLGPFINHQIEIGAALRPDHRV